MIKCMHECEICGQVCDCDGEDLQHDAAPNDCSHECDEQEEENE